MILGMEIEWRSDSGSELSVSELHKSRRAVDCRVTA